MPEFVDDKHPLPELIKSLQTAKDAAEKLRDSGSWMKQLALVSSFTSALKLHNEINGILNKTIERVQTQNKTKMGGRFLICLYTLVVFAE